ncbi:MAG: hypothetical protein JO353_05350 [Phycisphaerae bacterium]|nr:hypothetical protein [Phycisphaerae bacterium]
MIIINSALTSARLFVRRLRTHWIIWVLVLAYLGVTAWKVGEAGMRLRQDAWTTTRSIRFNFDITNAFHWGGEVNAIARRANGGVEPTFWQLVRAEDLEYRTLVENSGNDNYELDYPPGRLLTMALWRREVWRKYPNLAHWVNPLRGSAPMRRPGEPTEEIASPLLKLNSFNEASAAILAALIVGLWVWRSADRRRGLYRHGFYRRPRADGVIAFIITSSALFYGLFVAAIPSPAPPPSVTIASPPTVFVVADGRCDATIYATVNPQGTLAHVNVEWGTADGSYPNISDSRQIQGTDPEDLSIVLHGVPPKQTVHYRIVATNAGDPRELGRGTTQTDDATFISDSVIQPSQPRATFGAVWLDTEQWVELGIVFLAMCWSMRRMDPRHRAWAAAIVCATWIWFDPTLLIDAHVWPQWDSWLLPPFLLAVLMASLDCWLLAGFVIGIGMMFKGQFLIGTPVLIFWALAARRWFAALRLIIGSVLMAGLLLSPWITLAARTPSENPRPIWWIADVMIAVLIGAVLTAFRKPARRWITEKSREAKVAWHKHRAAKKVAATEPLQPARGLSPSLGTPGEGRGGGDLPVDINLEANPHPNPPPAYQGRGEEAAAAIVQSDVPPASSDDSEEKSLLPLAKMIGIILAIVIGLFAPLVLILKLWPADAQIDRGIGVWLFLAILIVPWFVPRRSLFIWAAAVLAIAIWISPYLFHGDWSWKTVGFEYGTQKFDQAAMSRGSNGNLPSILNKRFDWDLHEPAISLHLPNLAAVLYAGDAPRRIPAWMHGWGLDGTTLTLDLKQTMIAIYAIMLVACGFGAAMHARHRDPRILATFIAPWALMPNILCQMASRYHIWGVVLAAMLVGIQAELLVMSTIMSLLATGMISVMLLRSDESRSPQLFSIMSRLAPDIGWAMLAFAMIIFFLAVTPSAMRRRRC